MKKPSLEQLVQTRVYLSAFEGRHSTNDKLLATLDSIDSIIYQKTFLFIANVLSKQTHPINHHRHCLCLSFLGLPIFPLVSQDFWQAVL